MKIKFISVLFPIILVLIACTPTTEIPQLSNDDLVATQVAKIMAEQLQPSATPTSFVQVGLPGSPQPENSYRASLPGLSPATAVSQIEGYGFVCTLPELNNERTTQYCDLTTDEYQFTVTIWGQTAESVDLVEAVAFYYGDLYDYSDLTAVIFGKIAGLPYQGAVPEQASAWVQQTIPTVQNAGEEAINSFGEVRYYIYAMSSIQALEIGHLQK